MAPRLRHQLAAAQSKDAEIASLERRCEDHERSLKQLEQHLAVASTDVQRLSSREENLPAVWSELVEARLQVGALTQARDEIAAEARARRS